MTTIKVSLFDEKTKEKVEEMADTPIPLKYVIVIVLVTALVSQNMTLRKAMHWR